MSGETMHAVRYHGPGAGLVLEEVAVPTPGAGEAVVRVAAAGVCHTELQFLAGTLNLGVTPLTLGHEIAGTVERVGPAVRAVAPGDRVVVYYYAPCGECRWCASGQENLCPNTAEQVGFTADGGFAPYVRVPAHNLVPVPESLPLDEAATVGCSVATALHAVRAVADVRLGETAVVYGVGAVGFALVQLARLAGARVIAVGRTPEKLELARALGADATVNAAAEDPVAAVLALTDGEGAEVVFEGVASAATMDDAVRMLCRRGRLVFVGYGADTFAVNPLLLVLREARVLGAVGNTLAELREAVALAASGRVRAVVGARWPLEQADAALAALRAGRVVGRAVLEPTPSGPPSLKGRGEDQQRPKPFVPPSIAPSQVIQPPASILATQSASPGPPRPSELGHADDEARTSITPAPPPPSATAAPAATSSPFPDREGDGRVGHPLEPELLAFIGRGVDAPRDDDEFSELALRLFAYQFAHNAPYRKYCERKGATPASVTRWQDIPAVPIGAFKETVLACEPPEQAVACFQSSGTTGDKKSQHFHPSLAVYDLSATSNWQAHLLPEGQPMRLLVLSLPREDMPNSSLAHYLSLMVERYGAPGSGFLLRDGRLDLDAVLAALRASEASGEPVAVLGTSFAFVHVYDALSERGLRFALPPGSRIMDTGGFKGRSREVSRTELFGMLRDAFGVPRDYCVNMYGLTEHSTQFLDAVLRNHLRGVVAPRYKTVPPWARTRVLDPETLTDVPPGEMGLLCHYDLANRASALAVLTEDIGYALGEGFELVGRARGAEARGCSIAIDELLSATRGES
ncbi:MAG TPA: alcohol dehydrogenase catalytic domain-containing protein [Chloroflexota bacterium]|nr:alcohol dehydrogenase catalytic domain-containing protein [Chloroflexota bacterium]